MDRASMNSLLQEEAIKAQVSSWMEQYKSTTAAIAARIDLQQRNANVNAVLVTASAGYLFTFWSKDGYAGVAQTEFSVLFAIMPLLSLAFVWRHIDHDSNIVDFAEYVALVIRPELRALVGRDTITFESFLRKRRWQRIGGTFLVSILGNEAVIMVVLTIPYLGYAWFLRISEPKRAGSASAFFDALVYLDTALFLLTLYLLARSAILYGRLGSETEAKDSSVKNIGGTSHCDEGVGNGASNANLDGIASAEFEI
jgi:hypothetical protein